MCPKASVRWSLAKQQTPPFHHPIWVCYTRRLNISVVHYHIPEAAQLCYRFVTKKKKDKNNKWEMTFLYWECNSRRMTDSSPFLEEKEMQIHLDSSYIFLLIDSSLVESHIKETLKRMVFCYSSEVESSTNTLVYSHAFSGIMHFPFLHHCLSIPIHLMAHWNHWVKEMMWRFWKWKALTRC